MARKKGKAPLQEASQLKLPLLQQNSDELEFLRRENAELKAENAELKAENAALKSENSRLNRLVAAFRAVTETEAKSRPPQKPALDRPEPVPGRKSHAALPQPVSTVRIADALTSADSDQRGSAVEMVRASQVLSPDEKVALFRRLFTGRQDVYAVRWESQSTGRSGYSPARDHDYGSHTYDPRRKKKVCGGGCRDLPLTDDVLKHHLQGKHTIGTYPLLPDETTPFLAIDLDKSGWEEDARSLLESAVALDIPAYLERSRSGNGGHLWIFFERPLPAATARRLGDVLITRSNHGHLPLSPTSYDRMFPNQDTMPKLGYGNLIALPLQKLPLTMGNSAFVDSNLVAYADQWSFLQSIRRMPVSAVEAVVQAAIRKGTSMSVAKPSEQDSTTDDLDPWARPPSGRRKQDTLLEPPFPDSTKLVLGNFVYVAKDGLSRSHLNRLARLAAFQNPKFYEYQALRLSTHNIPRIICCVEEHSKYLALPRGCLEDLTELLNTSGAAYEIDDQRFAGRRIKAKFRGKLRPEQVTAATELLKNDTGVLSAATGIGKTVIAAYCLAKRKTNTLVLVHRRQLLEQWRRELEKFLEVPAQSIGQIGGGRSKPTGKIDIATIQSLYTDGEVNDLVADYGHVIVDECHHIGAVSFEQVLRQVKGKFVLGLTATPVRKDGHHPIVVMQCGPIRHKVHHTDYPSGIKEHVVFPRATRAKLDGVVEKLNTPEILTLLTSDEARNKLIIEDILKALTEDRTPLVLTERTQHLQLLAEGLEGKVANVLVFKGGMGKRQIAALRQKLESIPESEKRVVLATGRYIGEGFDDSRLDTLFLAMPISWRGTLEQYAGRLHRAHEGKSVVQIYDYVDIEIDKLYRMFKKRQAGYKRIGYTIDLMGLSR